MSRDAERRTRRYLGAAFVFQFATSLTAGLLSASLLDGGISEVLSDISRSVGQMRVTIVLELLTSVGIIVMTSLLYVLLHKQSRAIALVALALWMGEAVFLAVRTLGLYALLGLSQATGGTTVAGVAADHSLGSLALAVSRHAGDVDMLFFCLGAVLWYSLLYQSRVVPRALSVWGLLAVSLVLVATLMLVWDRSLDPSRLLYAPYVPFELAIGLWLLIKGAGVPPPRASGGRTAAAEHEVGARAPRHVVGSPGRRPDGVRDVKGGLR